MTGASGLACRSRRGFRVPRRRAVLGCGWAVLAAAAGCGEGFRVAEVSGTVTYRGRPVPGLMVQFQHRDALRDTLPVATGFTDEQGRYTLTRSGGKAGAVVGPNTATVSALGAEGGTDVKLPRDLAEKTFSFEVAPGTNTCDIDLGG